MSEVLQGGAKWFYSIPEPRRSAYAHERELLRSAIWGSRRSPQSQRRIQAIAALERLEAEIVRDYPTDRFNPFAGFYE